MPGTRRSCLLRLETLEERQVLSSFYHNLAAGPFAQDWSNLLQITQNDVWTASPNIVGYRGDNIVRRAGANPQFLTGFNGPTGPIVDVNPNQSNPDTSTIGGVSEFHLSDPVVALQGNSTADAPFIMLHVSTLGTTDVAISYNLRDIDGSADDAQTQVALQYRIGDTGPFINIPAGYVTDATTGPSQASLVTPVSAVLPSEAENQPKVQVRIMTADAFGNDEWVGIDDLTLNGTVVSPSTTLRIVSYNVSATDGTPNPGLDTVLQAIAAETSYGGPRPIDVLAIQEVLSQTTSTQNVVNLLNAIHGPGEYAHGAVNGDTTGGGTMGLVYRTDTIQLLAEKKVGISDVDGQPRQALRYHLRPIQIGSAADFYVYNSHYKADSEPLDEERRRIEAEAIRNDADALGQGARVLYVGDFNMYTSGEDAYQELLSAGNGQAVDPINKPGAWHDNAAFVAIFTQAPDTNPPSPLTGGGLDDRFDFQLTTGELLDGTSLDYITGSYHSFGNNGSAPMNGSIDSGSNSALPELANRLAVLGLLTTVSDHLPVVADYLFVPAGAPVPTPGIGTSSMFPQLISAAPDKIGSARFQAAGSVSLRRTSLSASLNGVANNDVARTNENEPMRAIKRRETPFLFSCFDPMLTMMVPIDLD